MTPRITWKRSLRAFFDERASEISGVPSIQDLCFIAGREPRLWSDPGMRADLAASIVDQCASDSSSNVLEVGCAAGFLAQLVAPHIGRYEGVDLASEPLRIARRLGLQNATFKKADGIRLPYPDNTFDAAFCYDVYTNFPKFDDGAGLIWEMIRVIKPGGRALVGSIPDAATEAAFLSRVANVMRELDERYGTPVPRPTSESKRRYRWWRHISRRLASVPPNPEVVCYYFFKRDFIELAARMKITVEICDIHSLNPYRGYRFNAIFCKPVA